MTTVEQVNNRPAYKHWDQIPLNAYIYSDILDDQLFNQLYKNIFLHLKQNTNTYGTHRTTFSHGGKNHAIIKHDYSAREQQFVYDLTFEEEWWHQTIDTIKNWSNDYLKKNINPIFYRYLTKIFELPPFNDNPNDWIPYRWHMNVLRYNNFLGTHIDTNPQYFRTKSVVEARVISLTYYLEDHVEGHGGELFALDGFVYKPKKNSAVGINGNQVSHGVRANLNPSKEPRYAFTTRWVHKDDLYLPGHPDKAMYALEW